MNEKTHPKVTTEVYNKDTNYTRRNNERMSVGKNEISLFTYYETIISKKRVYYESRNREVKRRLINEGRCDERLKGKL